MPLLRRGESESHLAVRVMSPRKALPGGLVLGV